jgi:phosphatidylserine decarboxylase precursor
MTQESRLPTDLLGTLEFEIVGIYDLPHKSRGKLGIKRRWTPFLTVSFGQDTWRTHVATAHGIDGLTLQEKHEAEDWERPRLASMTPEDHSHEDGKRLGADFYWQCPPVPIFGATQHWDIVFTAFDNGLTGNANIGSLEIETGTLIRDWYIGTGGIQSPTSKKLEQFDNWDRQRNNSTSSNPGTHFDHLTEDDFSIESYRFQDLILGIENSIHKPRTEVDANFQSITSGRPQELTIPNLLFSTDDSAENDKEENGSGTYVDDDQLSDVSDMDYMDTIPEKRIFGVRKPLFVERDFHLHRAPDLDEEGNPVERKPIRLRIKFAFNPYKNLMRNLIVTLLYGTTKLQNSVTEPDEKPERSASPSRLKRLSSAMQKVGIGKTKPRDPRLPVSNETFKGYIGQLAAESPPPRSASKSPGMKPFRSRSVSPAPPRSASPAGILSPSPLQAMTTPAVRTSSLESIESMTDDTATLSRVDIMLIMFYLNMSAKVDHEGMDRLFGDRDRIPIEEVVTAMDRHEWLPVPVPTPEEQEEMIREHKAQRAEMRKQKQSERPRFEPLDVAEKCPLCKHMFPTPPGMVQQRTVELLPRRAKSDHILTCANLDYSMLARKSFWRMGDFLTMEAAGRKWFSRWIGRFGFGTYTVGANDAYILVQNRETGRLEEELIPLFVRLGIRLLYQGSGVRSLVDKQRVQHIFQNMSIKQGAKYDRTGPKVQTVIREFINQYSIDLSDVEKPIREFQTFNEFFSRKLRPGARICAFPDDAKRVVSAADCRLTVHNTLQSAQQIWIKGKSFSTFSLLVDPEMGKLFTDCSIAIHRLAPQDYHRYHSPVEGKVVKITKMPGSYYTVNPMAIRSSVAVYSDNVREIMYIDTPVFGLVAFVAVGAMLVGSNVFTVQVGDYVRRVDELGYFKFGGSTCLLLIQQGLCQYDEDLVSNSHKALETLVKTGDGIGKQ